MRSSKSKLKINDFKLYELPVLTKILTLASLQGIADLLTGEGIRFNELEMDFKFQKEAYQYRRNVCYWTFHLNFNEWLC